MLVCGLELFLWLLFSLAMGWKHFGGVLPMAILLSIVSVTWKAIRIPAESPDAEPDEEPQPQSPDSLDSVAVEAAEPVVLEPIADESGSFEAIVCDGCTWLVAAESIRMRNGRSLCPSCVSALTAARSAQPAAALREMAPAASSALSDSHSRPVESSGPAVPVRSLESDTSRRRLSVWRLPMWLYCIFALATWYRSGWESESQALEGVLFGCLVAISVTIPTSLVFGAIGRSQAVASWSFVVLLLGVFAFQEADHRGLMDELSARVPGTGGGESAPSADSDVAASPDDQVAGMRIVDSSLKPVPPGTGAGDSENLVDYKRRALRIVESMTSTDRSKLPKRDRAFLKFHEGLTAEAVSATTKDSNASDRLDERALRLYGEAIEIDPSLAEAYVARGCILLNNHSEHARAIADHTRAIQLRPDYAKAYYHRADTYSDKGDSENTLSDLNQAIRLDPNFGAAYYMRAGCYKSRMQLDLYRSDLRKAQELKYESTSYPKFLAP